MRGNKNTSTKCWNITINFDPNLYLSPIYRFRIFLQRDDDESNSIAEGSSYVVEHNPRRSETYNRINEEQQQQDTLTLPHQTTERSKQSLNQHSTRQFPSSSIPQVHTEKTVFRRDKVGKRLPQTITDYRRMQAAEERIAISNSKPYVSKRKLQNSQVGEPGNKSTQNSKNMKGVSNHMSDTSSAIDESSGGFDAGIGNKLIPKVTNSRSLSNTFAVSLSSSHEAKRMRHSSVEIGSQQQEVGSGTSKQTSTSKQTIRGTQEAWSNTNKQTTSKQTISTQQSEVWSSTNKQTKSFVSDKTHNQKNSIVFPSSSGVTQLTSIAIDIDKSSPVCDKKAEKKERNKSVSSTSVSNDKKEAALKYLKAVR